MDEEYMFSNKGNDLHNSKILPAFPLYFLPICLYPLPHSSVSLAPHPAHQHQIPANRHRYLALSPNTRKHNSILFDAGNDKKLWQRYVDNLYTKEDLRQLSDKLKDPQTTGVLHDLMSDIWEESAAQSSGSLSDRERYKEEARRLLQRLRPAPRFPFRRLAAVAASVAAVCCLVLGGVYFWQTRQQVDINYLEVSTSYGERKEVRLPDGTFVMLNACSSVRYPEHFVGDERRVTLEGEGYFRVRHDDSQPFLVVTPSLRVRVLGTCFDVKAYSSDQMMSVDVEEGKVQVDLPEAMMRLKANEQMVCNTSSDVFNKQRMEHEAATWRKGFLYFDRTPMSDVVKTLERLYGCRIRLTPGQTFDNLISGEHDNPNLESVLQSIEFTSGIHYRKEGNDILLYKD